MPTRRNVLISFGELTDDQFFAFVNFLFDEDISLTKEDNTAIIKELLRRGGYSAEPDPVVPESEPACYVAVSRIVQSHSDPNKSYRVEKIIDDTHWDKEYWTCTCKDYEFRGGRDKYHHCKHIKKIRNW